MVTLQKMREMAFRLPEVTEAPHFEKLSFRVSEKIFATYDEKQNRACVRLLPVDQSVFCDIDKSIIYPVPNKWGKQGWTLIELKKVKKDLFEDALITAYCTVAPKKLAEQVRRNADEL